MTVQKKRKWIIGSAVLAGLVICYVFFLLPKNLFQEPYSTVLEDRSGALLGAAIADDGQWRFPLMDSVPEKYRIAVLAYEDKRFDEHHGVDVKALGRAIRQNIEAGRVISGGSTLTMQVVKLSRKSMSRTYYEKVIEILMATRLELRMTKNEIFNLYAAHAPFGGNVVGLESACWRYFGRRPEDLSWAEAALLAVLPNNPSLLRPGKNHEKLKVKRDRLLQRLANAGHFDATALALAMDEPIPQQPLALPRLAPHLLDRAMQEGLAETKVRSSVDARLQQRAVEVIARHYDRLRGNQIHNAAAVIIDIQTGKTLAYVGNTPSGSEHHEQVDIIRAQRSTGSILKPFLYAAMLDEGALLPKTLMPDIPTSINGFAPRNFSHTYDGAVSIDQALIRSLNVPFVHALRDYRYEKFYGLLKKAGLTTLTQPADHYGLALILGGAEATLWEVVGSYGALAHQLNLQGQTPLAQRGAQPSSFHLSYLQDSASRSSEFHTPVSAASTWLTFQTLKELNRPGEETGWKSFSSSKAIAWKTGTSFGFRDGWAVGVTPRFVVGVWTGNADGEGRPGLIGTEAAAPILFELFAQLPGQSWFREPLDEMEYIAVCRQSGQRVTDNCSQTDSTWVTRAGLRTAPCRFHKVVYLSGNERYRINASCATTDELTPRKWFVLPPVQEYYYKSKNITYKSLPPYRSDCPDPASVATMDLVYPRPNARIFLPRELDGTEGSTVFEVAHRTPRTQIFWHLDGNYLGSTRGSHKMILTPAPGTHSLSVVDEAGQVVTRRFVVVGGGL